MTSFKNKFCDSDVYKLESLSSTISVLTLDIDLFVSLITSKLTVFVTNPLSRVHADKTVLASACALFNTEFD